MTIDNGIRVLAGIVMLISIGLSFVNPYWLILGGFVAVNLIQSVFTGFCPAAMIMKNFGKTWKKKDSGWIWLQILWTPIQY